MGLLEVFAPAVGPPVTRRSERWTARAAVAVLVVALGAAGFQLHRPDPYALPVADWFHSEAVATWTQLPVLGGSGASGSWGDHAQVHVDGAGRLLLEATYVTEALPPTVPAPTTIVRGVAAGVEQRAQLTLASDRQAAPGAGERGEILADLEVRCVRLVLSSDELDRPTGEQLRRLRRELEHQVASWLGSVPNGDACRRVRGFRG